MGKLIAGLALLATLFCGCESWGKFWSLNVLGVSPAEGSVGNATQSTVTLTFDQAIRQSSLEINTATRVCSGNIQFSVNNFQSCIRLKSAVLANGGNAVKVISYGFPNGQTVRIKITTAVRSENDTYLESDYVSNGFKVVSPPAPCSSGNCFIDLGAIPAAANAGAHVFLIESGIHAGKIMYIPGSSLASYVFDTATTTFSAGPTLIPCGTNNTSSQTIYLKTGPYAGKNLMFRANNSSATCIYRTESNDFMTNTPASLPTASFGSGLHLIELTSGPHTGKYFILSGNAGLATALYDPAANAFSDATSLSTAPNAGTTSLPISSGTNAGKHIVFFGNGTSDTGLFNPTTLSFATIVTMSFATMDAFSVQMLTSGIHAGKAVIFHSNNQANTSLYNPDTNSFATTISSSNNIFTGSQSFLIPYGGNTGKVILASGNNFNNTEIYSPGVSTASGPAIPFTIGGGSFAFPVETGLYPQTWIVMNTANYAVYFP